MAPKTGQGIVSGQSILPPEAAQVRRRYSHDELATLFSLGPSWAWETDAQHRFVFVSPAMESATGVRAADLIGRTRRDCFFVNGSLAPEALRHFDDLENHRPFSDFVFEARDRDGRQSWVSTSGVPRFDAGGRFVGHVGISRALSDGAFVQSGLKLASERIRRMETMLGEVFESVPVGIAIFDAHSRFVTSNAQYREIFAGFADLLLPGTPILTLLEAAWDRGIVANAHEVDAAAAAGARAEWISRRQRQHKQDDYRDVTVMSDGRHLQQISKRLPDGNFISVRVDITDRVRKAAELEEARAKAAEAEERLRAAIEALSTGFALWEPDGRLVLFNSRFEDMIGPGVPVQTGDLYPEVMRRILAAGKVLNTGLDFEAWLERDAIALQGSDDLEDTYPLCDGRWILRRVTTSADGRRVDIRTDITAIKQSEQRIGEISRAAEDARERLRMAIESLSTGFALWDAEDRLVVSNHTLKAMASPFIEFKAGESYETIMRRMVRRGLVVAANESGDPELWLREVMERRARRENAEYLYYSQDGRWILQRETMTPTGERVDVRTDITELKMSEARASEALEAAKLARQVLNELDEPIFVKDDKLRFVFCNAAFARIHGGDAARLEGRRARDVVPDADAAFYESSEMEVLRSGDLYETEEDYFEDGQERARLVRKSRIITGSGARYVAGYMFEVTAIRQRERALELAMRRAESADKAKTDFLANMSHEIRTPMNGVLSMAELLAQGGLDERQRMFVDVIRKSGETLLGTINNILDYSKIDAGSMAVEARPFPLRTMIEDVACMLAAKACEKDVRLIVGIAPDLPAVAVGDETRLRQVLENLVGNAIKFTDQGEIVIRAGGTVTDGRLAFDIRVIDTGCGIPGAALPHIFDRFAQVHDADTPRPGGTGLGLSIVSRLVDLMGGTCSVASEPGRGSTFRVGLDLPCPDPRPPSLTLTDALRGRRIIVVDESAAQREAVTEPLKAWGFETCGVEDVPTALSLADALCARGMPADLVILACDSRAGACGGMAAAFRSGCGFAPPPLVILHPLDTSAPTPGIAASAALPLRQAELFKLVANGLSRHGLPAEAPSPAQRQAPQAADPAEPAPAPGEGALAETPEAGPQAVPQAGAPRSRIDVLVAEDNPVNQLVMSQILDMTGLTYQIAADGAAAVDSFRELKPRLVLMDVAMPKLNGFQATAAIRDMAELGGDRVPIIGVTAHVTESERDACLRCGMSDHLAKPISPERLLARIAHWLPREERRKA